MKMLVYTAQEGGKGKIRWVNTLAVLLSIITFYPIGSYITHTFIYVYIMHT